MKNKQTATYFCNFVAKNNQKPSYQNGMKSSGSGVTLYFLVKESKCNLKKALNPLYVG